MALSRLPDPGSRGRINAILVVGCVCVVAGPTSESCTVYDDIVVPERGGSSEAGGAPNAGSAPTAGSSAGASGSARGGAGGISEGGGSGGKPGDSGSGASGNGHKGGDSQTGGSEMEAGGSGAHVDASAVGGAGGGVAGGPGETGTGVLGGSAGSSGVGGAGTGGASGDPAMIDDMERQQGSSPTIDTNDGRSGPYYKLVDSSADPQLYGFGRILNGDPGRSDYAMQVFGAGFGAKDSGSDYWGAGVGFDLAELADGGRSSYDASRYSGVQFWVKLGPHCLPDGGIGSCQTKLILAISDAASDPEGGECSAKCYDDWSVTTKYEITYTWHKESFVWKNFSQQGWGDPKPQEIDSSKLFSFKFKTEQASRPFDYEIDDISFLSP